MKRAAPAHTESKPSRKSSKASAYPTHATEPLKPRPNPPAVATSRVRECAARDASLESPLSYCIPSDKLNYALRTVGSPNPTYWSHNLYRSPHNEEVIVHYCKTRTESEAVARRFLDEKVLGFDMEWKWKWNVTFEGIKNNVSLIQLACEKEIALFHIALHEGDTPDRLLAPTLRRILESPEIAKTGVNIQAADASRLTEWFGIRPLGLFELSHLYTIIECSTTPSKKLNRKMHAMAKQVQEHLELPILKDNVRRSDWTKPLTRRQIDYAASDAYAGFMLYHAMENKRKGLKPIPPRPCFAELDQPLRLAEGGEEAQGVLQDGAENIAVDVAKTPKDLVAQDATLKPSLRLPSYILTAENPAEELARLNPCDLRGVQAAYGIVDCAAKENSIKSAHVQRPDPKIKPRTSSALNKTLDPVARQILSALRSLRLRLSDLTQAPPDCIASDRTLEFFALQRARNVQNLLRTPGIAGLLRTAEQHGIDVLRVIEKNTPALRSADAVPAAEPMPPVSGVKVMPEPVLGSNAEPGTNLDERIDSVHASDFASSSDDEFEELATTQQETQHPLRDAIQPLLLEAELLDWSDDSF